MTFPGLPGNVDPHGGFGGVGVKFVYLFSGQFMTFPGLLIFYLVKPPGVGDIFFRRGPVPSLSEYVCQIWSRSDSRVKKKGGTDRHTDKGTLQLYNTSRIYWRVYYTRATSCMYFIYLLE